MFKKTNHLIRTAQITWVVCVLLALAESAFAQGTWTTKTPAPEPRFGMAGIVIGDRLLLFGGSLENGATAVAPEIYDAVLDGWSFGAAATVPRSFMAAGELNGKVYVAGGWVNSDSSASTGALEIYDPASDSWTTAASMPTARGQAAVGTIGGKMYVAGGRANWGNQFATLEIYDSITGGWSMGAPLLVTVEHPGSAAFNGKLYVLGGFNFAGSLMTGALQIYDPATDSWSFGAPMPTPRSGAMVAVLDNKLFVIGGHDGSAHTTVVEIYDPIADSWTTGSPVPEPAMGGAVGVLGSQLYVAFGYGYPDAFSLQGTLYSFTAEPEPLDFAGFLGPIGGADDTGGSFAAPLRTFRMGSTIPVKFTLSSNGEAVLTGVHTLQAVKFSSATTFGTPIDATPQDAATPGNQFRLTDAGWHFNLATAATGMSVGIWQLLVTVSDGSQHTVWIQLK